MTLEQLRMLKMVAQEGSLKAASERMHKTQAAISQGIKQLESKLDIALFDRRQYRLELTPQGRQIYQRALKLLTQATEIELLSEHFSTGHETSITLAFEGSFDLSRVLPILENIQNRYPDTQIILQQEYLTGAFDALENGKTDLIISPADGLRIQSKNVESAALYNGEMVNVAAPKLLARHPNLRSAQELEKEYQIVVQDSGTGTQGVTLGVKDGQRCWYVNDLSTKKVLTLSGMGWGKLPTYLIKSELASGALQRIYLEDSRNELEITYYAMRKRNQLAGPVSQKLWQSLRALSTQSSNVI